VFKSKAIKNKNSISLQVQFRLLVGPILNLVENDRTYAQLIVMRRITGAGARNVVLNDILFYGIISS